VAPAATVTDAGTVNTGDALFVNVTTAPPMGAACEIVAVHCVLWLEESVVAVQLSPVIVGDDPPETLAVPPVAESVSADAAAEALMGLRTPIIALFTPEAKVRVTVATVPFGMRSRVLPATTHI